jgi:hypothetical protein
MTFAPRLLPLALTLLSLSIQSAHAAGAFSREPYSAASAAATATLASRYVWRGIRQPMSLNMHAGDGRVAGNEGMDWRDLKAGLSRKFEGGWSLSGTYSRAFDGGGAGAFERYAGAMPRTDLRPLPGSRSGRGAIVLNLSRRF